MTTIFMANSIRIAAIQHDSELGYALICRQNLAYAARCITDLPAGSEVHSRCASHGKTGPDEACFVFGVVRGESSVAYAVVAAAEEQCHGGGVGLGYVWLNSCVDALACVAF
jgi:hypothetical protein